MTELQHYIQEYFGITSHHLNQISELFYEEEMKKDEFMVEEGSYCQKLSFVRSGFIRIYRTHEDKEITQWISVEGDFVTELSSLVFNTRSRWNIQMITDCELYSINKSDYQRLGNLVPEWEKLEKLFLAKCFVMLENRVFSFLSMTAEERLLQLIETRKEVLNQVQLTYIASMLGMTPETLSRIRKKLIS